jgi:hypothetical protein
MLSFHHLSNKCFPRIISTKIPEVLSSLSETQADYPADVYIIRSGQYHTACTTYDILPYVPPKTDNYFILPRPTNIFQKSLFSNTRNFMLWTVLKRLVAGLSPRRLGAYPRAVQVGLLVGEVAVGLPFLPLFPLPLSI